jgi:hypothetical protein
MLNIGLPKWPQMYVTGDRVTPEQAKEIIRRTDTFLVCGYGGNDSKGDLALSRRLRMPHFDKRGEKTTDWSAQFASEDLWKKTWGAVETQFVKNSWISCSFIFGPHGWCSPDGRIAFGDNVGKWPPVEEILSDWATIASQFPFLNLAATLMSGEQCEENTQPLATILVDEGTAKVVVGDMKYHTSFEPASQRSDSDMVDRFSAIRRGGYAYEHGPIPEEWYAEWEALAVKLFG